VLFPLECLRITLYSVKKKCPSNPCSFPFKRVCGHLVNFLDPPDHLGLTTVR